MEALGQQKKERSAVVDWNFLTQINKALSLVVYVASFYIWSTSEGEK
jgi:hypothetical protein